LEPGPDLVVSGPYRVARWDRGQRLVLEPNPLAFTARPATDTVVLRLIPDQTTRLVEFENGELDVTTPVEISEAPRIGADRRFRIETVDDRFYDYIAWNDARFQPFGDPDIRLALSLAIDRRGIIDGLELGRFARPAAGPYPPIFGEVSDPSLQPDPYLPDSARAILASRGWQDSDGDGVLDRDGTAFRFTLLTQAGNQRRNSAAEIIQAAYGELGIEMQVRPVEFNSLLGSMFEGREFEAVLMGWQVALAPNYLAGFFWPPAHPYNITGFASARLDSLIPDALAAPTAVAAAPHWREAARVIADERPYAFLWYYDDIVAVNEDVQNTRIDTYGLLQNLHQWTVR
jgi:peptide/nickel transport system substrate-binding protein